MKTQYSESERKLKCCAKVQYLKVVASKFNQPNNSQHLQRFAEPLKVSVWVSRLHDHGGGCGLRLECIESRYKCHIPGVKPPLKQRPRRKRLTWAGEIKNWIVALLFSDESKFSIFIWKQRLQSLEEEQRSLHFNGNWLDSNPSQACAKLHKAEFYVFSSIFSIHKR